MLIDALGVMDCEHLEVYPCSSILVHPKHFWKLHHIEGFVER